MKKLFFVVLVLVGSSVTYAQRVGVGTNSPHTSSLLELSSNDKGFLMPRMTTAQRKAVVTPANGLLVFDTDKATIYMFDGIQWLPLTGNANGIAAISRSSNTPSNNAGFGASVALDGNYAVISTRKVFEQGSHVDSAYVFYKVNGSWNFQAKLVQSDPVAGDWFGYAVGISGDQIFVGAPKRNQDRGAVYVFSRNGNLWNQTDILTPVNEDAGAQFGWSITMEGNYALVGAPGFESAGVLRGAAFNFVKGANGWEQMQALLGMSTMTTFGYSLDISGTSAIIGAPGATYNGVDDAGIAYFFKRTGSFWFIYDTAYNSVPQQSDRFGSAVAINESINWAFIGRPGRSYAGWQGDVLAYTTTANYLYYQHIISLGYFSGTVNQFGNSLSMTNEYLIVGAPNSGNPEAAKGKMFIYKYDPTWPQYQYKWGIHKIVKDESMLQGIWAGDTYGWSVYIDNYDVIWGNPGANHQQGKVMFINLE